MAFPTVVSTAESSVNTAGASHAVTLPASIAASDLVLITMDIGSVSATLNALTDWTELLDEAAANGLKILYYSGAGVPSNPTFTSSANTRSASIAWRISASNKSIAPQIGTTATGTSATPDPPASASPGSTKDYLFIAFAGMAGEEADDDTWGNTPPTNYLPSPPLQKACGIAGTNLGGLILAASRQLNTGAAENPGTFGVDVSAAWRAQTIMVHPIIDTPLTPSTKSLTVATFAPTVTVTNNVSLTPATKALVVSAFAPTVILGTRLTPATQSLTVATFAPSVLVGTTLTPATKSLVVTAFAPSVAASENIFLTPGTNSATTATFAPAVAVSDHKLLTPGNASLAVATFAPTVAASDNKVLTPGARALVVSTFAPTVTADSGTTLTPGTLSVSIATFAPTVAVSDSVSSPGGGRHSRAAFVPSFSGGGNLAGDLAELDRRRKAKRKAELLVVLRKRDEEWLLLGGDLEALCLVEGISL